MMNTHQATLQEQTLLCPQCRQAGRSVTQTTLRALLVERVQPHIGESLYRFCGTPGCDIVYYAEDGSHTFSKADLTVRVGVKEADSPRPVCYCFDHTIEEIEDEVRRTGQSTVLDDIKTRMKTGCWCETSNPQGACCLGTVRKYVKHAMEKFGEGESPLGSAEFEDCCAEGAPNPSCSPGGKGSLKPTGRAEKITQMGAVLAAVVASACCWLPLLLVALGVSGFAVSATLEQYRPMFLTVTFVLLGAAFYFTYRRRPVPVSATAAESCCEPAPDGVAEATCCLPGERMGMRLRRFNKVVLWLVTAVVLAFALFPNYAGLIISEHDSALAAEQHLVNALDIMVAIEGMTCEACASLIRANLEKLPGVKAVTVSFANKSARIVVDKEQADTDASRGAVESAGFKAAHITPVTE